MSDRASTEDYAKSLLKLSPEGPAWPKGEDSTLYKLYESMAALYRDAHNRGVDLLSEMIPDTSDEMLPDWEKVCGLPDDCVPEFQSIADRQEQVALRLALRGGQNEDYYLEIAERYGWNIEIYNEYRFQVESSTVEQRLTNDNGGEGDLGWVHAWRVKALDIETSVFKVDNSTVEQPLRSFTTGEFQCLIDKWKPAHTRVFYDYSEAVFE